MRQPVTGREKPVAGRGRDRRATPSLQNVTEGSTVLARNATEEELYRLYRALTCVSSTTQAAALLKDICTIAEVNEMAQRLEVALLLDAGESYLSIQEKTGSSPTTIARVSRSLNYGPGGYRSVIDALKSVNEGISAGAGKVGGAGTNESGGADKGTLKGTTAGTSTATTKEAPPKDATTKNASPGDAPGRALAQAAPSKGTPPRGATTTKNAPVGSAQIAPGASPGRAPSQTIPSFSVTTPSLSNNAQQGR
jgi:TrpR-related protein YerC/YecD